jgi:hypothetical protein
VIGSDRLKGGLRNNGQQSRIKAWLAKLARGYAAGCREADCNWSSRPMRFNRFGCCLLRSILEHGFSENPFKRILDVAEHANASFAHRFSKHSKHPRYSELQIVANQYGSTGIRQNIVACSNLRTSDVGDLDVCVRPSMAYWQPIRPKAASRELTILFKFPGGKLRLRSQMLSIGRRLHIRSFFLGKQQISSHSLPYLIRLPSPLHDP